MRPAGRAELDSLYFDYPTFEAPRRGGGGSDAPVAICGAGPIGLLAALVLARHGVASVVLDRKATFNDGSRAICVARHSYRIIDRVGALAPFLEKSLGWTDGISYYRGRQVLEFSMPHGENDRFLPMYNLQQQYIEQFLHDAVAASPLIDMRWQSEVIGVADREGGVGLTVRDPAGEYTLETTWLIAADGARSPVRRMRNLRLEGENYEGRYVIADVKMRHDFPTKRRALFDPACNPGGTVLIHRQPDDVWRVDYQLRPGEEAEEATREENVRAQVGAVLAEIGHDGPWELEWWSVYSANTLALADYRDGRILFAGDSAHIVPIFGVRGLNNGLADAENIGWKLAYVIRGLAGDGLLDSYTPERRGATLDVFANATRSTRFMTPPDEGWRIMRDAALSLAVDHAFARPFANPRQMVPYTYAGSPLTQGADAPAGSAPGDVAPDVRLGDGHLLDRIGTGFTCLLFGGDEAQRQAVEDVLRRQDPAADALRIAPSASGPSDVADPDGRIAQVYSAREGQALLIRPDLYIAARWPAVDPEAVGTTLSTLLGSRT